MGKDKYKVRNWSEYNEGLKKRGAITIWIHKDAIEQWRYQGEKKKGGQFTYSDKAIEICLIVRKVYHPAQRRDRRIYGKLLFADAPAITGTGLQPDLQALQDPAPQHKDKKRKSHY